MTSQALRRIQSEVGPNPTRLEEEFADLMDRAAASLTPRLKQQIEKAVEAIGKEHYNRGFLEGSRRY